MSAGRHSNVGTLFLQLDSKRDDDFGCGVGVRMPNGSCKTIWLIENLKKQSGDAGEKSHP